MNKKIYKIKKKKKKNHFWFFSIPQSFVESAG